MSRIVVFGIDGRSVGEFEAPCSRVWQLAGHPGVSGGGSTKVSISADIAAQDWLELGRAVLIEHEKLPPWAGVIDTPWIPSLPVQLTIYNIEYLLNLRVPERTPGYSTLAVSGHLGRLLHKANKQEDTLIRMGQNGLESDPVVDEKMDQRRIWEQMAAIIKKYGAEIIFNPKRDSANRLAIDLDCATRAGQATGFELQEGQNAVLKSVSVEGDFRNCLYGAGNQSTEANRLSTTGCQDDESISRYRLRSNVFQTEAPSEDALWVNVRTALKTCAWPRLKFTVEAMDIGDTFNHLRLGNSLIAHYPNLYLPGGKRGWRGMVRILAMALNEPQNTVSMTMEGAL